jgi:hypothetical protein
MALKTQQHSASVTAFLNTIDDEQRRTDCLTVADIMKRATKTEPRMWGSSIVGFGSYHYRYESGREGDWFVAGFSPRKQDLTLYIVPGVERYPALLKKLGKYKTGRSCLYIKRLSDIDQTVLRELIEQSVRDVPRIFK